MIELDTSILLGNGAHGDQARGGKIGFKAPRVVLDPSMLLGHGPHLDQAHGAKIGGKGGGLPAGQAGSIVLDTEKLLGHNGLGQAAGAKIGQVKTDTVPKS